MSASRGSFGPSEGANERLLTINEGEDVADIQLVLPRYDKTIAGVAIVINVRGDEPGGHVGETREVTLPEAGNAVNEVEIAPFRLLPVPRRDGGFGAGMVGVRLSNREGPPTVVEVVPDSPAARAGLLPGTVIRAIDGKDVSGYGRTATMVLLRGAPGTEVTVTVETGRGNQRSVRLVREDSRGR